MWRDNLIPLSLFLLTACELGVPAGTEQYYELNSVQMADQPKIKPQRADIFGTKVVSTIAPAEGSVAVNATPYPYLKEEADLAGANVKNPLPASPEVLAKGEAVFKNYCVVCHGLKGEGDGPLTKKFPPPPSLLRQVPRDYTDGRIFHNPMRGQNSMPAYSAQIDQDEIWAAVHYVRKLQASNPVAPPTDADLKKAEEKRKAEEAAQVEAGLQLAADHLRPVDAKK